MCNWKLSGAAGILIVVKDIFEIKIKSRISNYKVVMKFGVLEEITGPSLFFSPRL